ncbi:MULTISPECIES: RagB/SusD family nutrient uptake outer membrane protein [Chryseobacterium]|uniref:RagB/SusD family nutrient uptake outer membrane protein n=1 Tax=Chryseobacterium nakagawai TaxID=1241982 RepID=A0AAD1DQG8_CHRNA|nr:MULTISPECIES: RagB/SusD family nutrient uptake outer membrane protein [Chryseobacterium]AZA89839.1 RagB/SusD family nutrient uptake outer membrane protein [Chryseobacterium nakagawai]VEH21244.1 SusD family [Chryseobacterium nakagawai]VFA41313.1 SusD family [Chryseobacterium indologenes]
MATNINKITAIAVLCILTTLISCEKMLEVDLPENQMLSETVFQDAQTANSVLSGLYAGLWEASPIAGDQSGRILSLYTDDLTYYAVNATNGLPEISNNTLIDTNQFVSSVWSAAYQKIYVSNSIIEGLNSSSSISAAEKNRMTGEALTIRSLLFFYLQQIYGDIPYPVTTNYQINQSITKTNSEEVLQRIESDLTEAVELLPDQYRSAERIFINKKTAQLMLAKVQMQRSKYAEAESTLKAVIQSPLYQFQNDITKVFLKSGTHIIWQLKPKNSGDPVREATLYYFANVAPYSMSLSPALVSSFQTGDLRKQHWMAAVTVAGTTWYRAEKYKARSANTMENSIVFRLEEAYLLLAESLAKQNKTAEALPYINPIRQRAAEPLLASSVSQNTLLDEILKENRKEFFTEMGHRFIDLKRAGQLNTLQTTKTNWKDFHKVWPLPQKELLMNPNMNPQNSGY